MAPFPGHWQSRRGPQPLHSDPWTYVSLGSFDGAGPGGGWGYCCRGLEGYRCCWL